MGEGFSLPSEDFRNIHKIGVRRTRERNLGTDYIRGLKAVETVFKK